MNKANSQFIKQLAKISFLAIAIPVSGSLLSVLFFDDWLFNHEPLHAVFETYGAFIAFGIIALILWQETQLKLHPSKLTWVVCALLAMGLFDLFHAANKVGNNFIWLHSLASFAGGSLFAGVCIPRKWYQPSHRLIYITGICCLIVGIVSLLCPNWVPSMKIGADFSPLAMIMNTVGGAGYLFAFAFFVFKYRQDRTVEEYLLSAHCLLFGVASILFDFSVLWDFAWWWWHLLRLVAYMILLYFFYDSFRDTRKLRLAQKSFDRRIQASLEKTHQIHMQKEKFKSMALVDPLTGISNRHDFELVFNNIIEAAEPSTRFALLLIDVDNFKDINDCHGHSMGDYCLKEIAQTIKQTLGEKHFVSRIGGDEFAAIIYLHGEASAVGFLAKKLNKACHKRIYKGSISASCSISIGIACYPNAGTSIDKLLRHADLALYRTKTLGRNGFSFFTAAVHQAFENRLKIYRLLSSKLSDNFCIVMQPIFRLGDNQQVGYEVLCRTTHPLPDGIQIEDIIEAAEKNNRINELTFWVVRQALNVVQQSPNTFTNQAINFNISPASLDSSQNFIESLHQLIQSYAIDPNQICFEITESALVASESDLEPQLKKLAAYRYKLALDDFGKGQSSFSRLTLLPVSYIKIDKCFINQINDSKAATQIYSAMIQLCHNLKLTVIAEGIESEQQLHQLKQMHCDYGQGFYLGTPFTSPPPNKAK